MVQAMDHEAVEGDLDQEAVEGDVDDDGMVMILRNTHCTLYGNQISEYFNCYPPSLEEYFGVVVVVVV